ncbi:MAG: glycosyltransferase [Caulobacterales bacterium]|nr:glycosyltransferase [Caulobacterales bacterium]
MTRALHLLGSAADGGAETYFADLVTALHASGHPTAAAIRRHAGRQAVLAATGVPFEVFRFGSPLDLATRPAIRRYAQTQGSQILVAWMNRAARHCPKGPWARVGRLGGYYDLKNYRGFDALVGNTADIRDWIVAQGWPAERAHFIPNFAEPDDHRAQSRALLDTPREAPLLLAMGRLHDAKAHDVTLKALARIPDAVLWIAGTGPLEGDLRELAHSLGVAERVRWLGWRSDAGALYRAADLVVFPSRFEPLGNVVIQAWAYGKPVIAARAAGPGALIRDGEDGLLVPVDDPTALAEAIAHLLSDPAARQSLAANGLVRAQTVSKSAILPQWDALFDQLARERT